MRNSNPVRTAVRHLLTAACAALALGLTLAGCGDYAVVSPADSGGDRAFALAREIVTGLASSYADRHHEGEAQTYALDLSSLNVPHTFGGTEPISDPMLEDGLRRFAETLPTEGAAWILRIHPFVREPDGAFAIYAEVDELQPDLFCNTMEAARLAEGEDGWVLEGFFLGGFLTYGRGPGAAGSR